MLYDKVYTEENILDSIKNIFNNTKNEHILIGLISNDNSSIEKLLTEGTNPIFTKEEFRANKSSHINLVKSSISTVLRNSLDKDYVIYNIRSTDGSDDSEELYHFRMRVLDAYGDNHAISSNKLKDLKRTLDKYKKIHHTLEKRYKKQISETVARGKKCSNLIDTLKPMILKKTIGFAMNWINKRMRNDPFTSGDDRTPFGRFIKELHRLEVACLNIELKVIESSIKHNNSLANAIVSKIKSQVQKDLKSNRSVNESMVLYELRHRLEQL